MSEPTHVSHAAARFVRMSPQKSRFFVRKGPTTKAKVPRKMKIASCAGC